MANIKTLAILYSEVSRTTNEYFTKMKTLHKFTLHTVITYYKVVKI